MAGSSDQPVLVPVHSMGQKLDNEDPKYFYGKPDIYLALALAYDSLAAPTAVSTAGGVWEGSYATMQPRLALGWEEQDNGDWIVRLRPGVRSHAGREFTSADIKWAFEKSFAHKILSSWRWRDVVGLVGVDPLDRYSVRYRLRAPFPTFQNWLFPVTPNMVDSTTIREHATADDPWGVEWLRSNVAGYGPYRLDSMDSSAMLFSRRADYWMQPPDVERVEVRKWTDSRADAIRLLDDSRPTVIVGTITDETASLIKRDDLNVQRAWAGHTSVEIDFRQPPFDDRRVRHALAFATPYEALIRDGLMGLAKSWHSPVKSNSQWYNGGHWHYRHDIAEARRLMREAGYGDGFTSDFYLEHRPDAARLAEIIAKSWREIGVELVMKDIADAPPRWMPPLQLRVECVHNMSEPIYDIAHDYVATGRLAPRWSRNDEAIELYDEVLAERDHQKKRALFDKLQKDLVDFSSSIFIAEVQQGIAANKHVSRSLLAPDSRFFQALLYQNAKPFYLPDWRGGAHPD